MVDGFSFIFVDNFSKQCGEKEHRRKQTCGRIIPRKRKKGIVPKATSRGICGAM